MTRKINCPLCHKRAMDATDETTGTVSIKCPQCHNIVKIKLNTKKLPKWAKT